MPLVSAGLCPEHARLWQMRHWRGGREKPAWEAEARRIADLSSEALRALEPASLDDWQRCLAAERLLQLGYLAEAESVLDPVGADGRWHAAVSYLDVFQALAEAWRAEPERRVAVLRRAEAYARTQDAETARAFGLLLAEALWQAGQVDAALDILRAQLVAQPLDPWPYLFLGTTLLQAGHPAWADAALRRGLEVLRLTRDPQGLWGAFQARRRAAAGAGAGAGDGEEGLPAGLGALLGPGGVDPQGRRRGTALAALLRRLRRGAIPPGGQPTV